MNSDSLLGSDVIRLSIVHVDETVFFMSEQGTCEIKQVSRPHILKVY